jgi:hypothetical protein
MFKAAYAKAHVHNTASAAAQSDLQNDSTEYVTMLLRASKAWKQQHFTPAVEQQCMITSYERCMLTPNDRKLQAEYMDAQGTPPQPTGSCQCDILQQSRQVMHSGLSRATSPQVTSGPSDGSATALLPKYKLILMAL